MALFGLWFCQSVPAQFAAPEEVYKTDMESVTEAVVLDAQGTGADNVLIFGEGGVRLFRNGSGPGTPVETCMNSTSTWIHAVGDIDGDGFDDIICANQDVSHSSDSLDIIWYRNSGDTSFSFGTHIHTGAFHSPEIKIQDVDGDGRNDVLALWYENTGDVSINWFRQLPDGSFGSRNVLMTNMGVSGFAMADLDGDNDLDLVTADYSIATGTNIRTWYQQDGGSFSAGGEQIVSGSSTGLWLYDLDQDGAPDLFLGESLRMLRNDGNGGWEIPEALLSSTIKEGFADINGDGLLDVWGTNESYSGSTLFRYLNYRLADGSGGLLPTVTMNMGSYSFIPAWTDLTGDGVNDLVFCSRDWQGEAGYLTGNGIGGYDGFTRITRTMTDVKWLGVADINSDGDKDIIVMSQQDRKVSWLEDLGNGRWLEHLIWKSPVYNTTVWTLLVMDADGNGTPDVLLFGTTDSNDADTFTTWYMNDGSGNLTAAAGLPSVPLYLNYQAPVMKAVDLDQDGKLDILEFRGGIWYWHALAGGGFEEPVQLLANTPLYTNILNGDIADVDGDGDLDIVGYVTGTSDHVLSFMENNGSNVFSAPQAIPGGEDYSGSIKLWDIDEDGDLDVFATTGGNGGEGAWFENVDGSFTVKHALGPYANSLVEDFDMDGDLDLATNVYNADQFQFELLQNSGAGQFMAPTVINPVGAGPVAAEDMDGDGDLDLIMAHTPNAISIYRNLANSMYRIEGTAFMDLDGNGIQGPSEPGLPSCQVQVGPDDGTALIDGNGQFTIYSSEGSHSFTVASPSSAWQATTPTEFDVELTSAAPVASGYAVGFEPVSPQEAVVLDATGSYLSCDGQVPAWVTLTNTGTTIFNGEVKLPVPPLIAPVSATPPADVLTGDTMIWQVNGLVPGAQWTTAVHFTMPGAAQQGGEVAFLAEAFGQGADPVAEDSVHFVIICGGSSNQLLCDPSGSGEQHFIPYATDHLDFTLLFMNLGIDTVQTIFAQMAADPMLDMNDVQLIGGSAPVTLNVIPTGDGSPSISFIITGMQLPPVAQSSVGSQGAFTFRVPIDHDVVEHGSLISTYMTLQMYGSGINSYTTNNVDLMLQDCSPFDAQIRDTLYDGGEALYLPYGYTSYQWFLNGDPLPQEIAWLSVPSAPGTYTAQITDQFGCEFTTEPFIWIITSSGPELERPSVKVYPDPASDWVRVEVSGKPIDNWGLFDSIGRFIFRGNDLADGVHEFYRGDLAPGLYFIHSMDGSSTDRTAYPVLFK